MVFFVFVFVCSFRCGSGYSSQRVYFWRLDYVSNYLLLLEKPLETTSSKEEEAHDVRLFFGSRYKKTTTCIRNNITRAIKKALYLMYRFKNLL